MSEQTKDIWNTVYGGTVVTEPDPDGGVNVEVEGRLSDSEAVRLARALLRAVLPEADWYQVAGALAVTGWQKGEDRSDEDDAMLHREQDRRYALRDDR